jgi:hypothetical protein
VTERAKKRWKLLGACLAAAVAWEYLYADVLDREGKLNIYLASGAPAWLQSLHRLSPSFLAVRLLNVLGFRFDIAHYDDNTGFVIASVALSVAIWTGLLFGIALWIRRGRHESNETAAA